MSAPSSAAFSSRSCMRGVNHPSMHCALSSAGMNSMMTERCLSVSPGPHSWPRPPNASVNLRESARELSALFNGVHPRSVSFVKSAPRERRRRIMGMRLPLPDIAASAATWRGVFPRLSVALMSPPSASSTRRASWWSLTAQRWSGRALANRARPSASSARASARACIAAGFSTEERCLTSATSRVSPADSSKALVSTAGTIASA
mmetsp:Transcript_16201/g.39097  ORF Transcript_16201/g.39097 Transcript_16201/m.39097 type:complete len:205 (+) Transcript_16201:764-1378(+)